ncbi:hypothetical protein [Escherichia coli]
MSVFRIHLDVNKKA